MDTINAQLELKFKEWKDRLIQDTQVQSWDSAKGGVFFTKDGIVNSDVTIDNAWEKLDRRIAFILKDQFQRLDDKGHHSDDDARYYNTTGNSNFFTNLRNLFWGLSHTSKHKPCTWDSVLINRDNVREYFQKMPYALIEAKKTPGEGKLPNNRLNYHLNKYGDLLWGEINILKPNFIICCSQKIFEKVLEKYPKENGFQIFENHGWVCYDKVNKVFIIHALHPSSYGKEKSHKEHFEFVMNPLNAVLQELPEEDLPDYLL